MSVFSRSLPLQVLLLAGLSACAAVQAANFVEEEAALRHSASAAFDGKQLRSSSALENLVEFSKISSDGRWVFGSITRPVAQGRDEVPTARLFVAYRAGQGWEVGVEGEALFHILLNAAPEDVVTAGEKATFTTLGRGQQGQMDTQTGLALPWREGVSWYMGGGPHGNSGSSRPFDSIDFNGGDGRVLAPRDGRIYKSCIRNGSALIKLVHDNGYSTSYYHMRELTTIPDGTLVSKGTYLGRIDVKLPCGGSASGPHVHFTLSYNGQAVPVDGKVIGGWRFTEGSRAYQGYATRDGKRVNVGGALFNYGAGQTPPPGNQTGTVRSPDPQATINLRSRPSLSAEVVGTVKDGAQVELRCHAYGDWVDGVWKRTNLWNKLVSGEWISDGFVDTGSNEPVVSLCE
ncbi:peptidoglycan DD-metalloendopeptidase family protein [Chitinimonas lacunae]|uniref:Peptidoglycan DD-metalloendopeptidase family protein n=1 Tax=Chitinimonas lacunae TaxID=1963018 RepID=A0ABV8MMD3_9NEIS